MKKNRLILLLFLTVFIKTNAQLPSQLANSDKEFNNFKQKFVDSLWVYYPSWATYSGYHLFDHVLAIPDEVTERKQAMFLNRINKKLQGFDLTLLSVPNRIDYY